MNRGQFPTRTGDLCYLALKCEDCGKELKTVSNPNGRPLLFSLLGGATIKSIHSVSNPNGRPLLFSLSTMAGPWTLPGSFQPERATSAI